MSHSLADMLPISAGKSETGLPAFSVFKATVNGIIINIISCDKINGFFNQLLLFLYMQ